MRSIFEMYLDHQSMAEVATILSKRRDESLGVKWTASKVSTILRTRLYVGEYNIGNSERQIPEYRIVSPVVFREAARVRRRFHRGKSARPQMSRTRRRSRVSSVLDQYVSWLT